METKEWRFTDKSDWEAGPWQSEPDKMQWMDEATGLPCLIVRGPVGALCGYVGVPEGHPLYGVGYSSCPRKPKCEESWCDHTPESGLRVHGGLTYSDRCVTSTREDWEKFRARMNSEEHLAEVSKYPNGDSAEREKNLRPLVDNYEAWVDRREATSICHLPSPGEPDHVWWFGFDCAHSGDMAPKMSSRQYRELGISSFRDGEYRDIEYVKYQVASLARQLKECATA